MTKFQLNSGETLIGSGMMSIYLKQGLGKKPFQGNIYITNQRATISLVFKVNEQMSVAKSVSVIGGADGPTSIFVTGEIGGAPAIIF
mgnify:CR=1 FL=1